VLQVIVQLEKNPYCEFTTYVATDFDTEYRDALLSTTTSSKVAFKVGTRPGHEWRLACVLEEILPANILQEQPSETGVFGH
jgi:hypothetical protein